MKPVPTSRKSRSPITLPNCEIRPLVMASEISGLEKNARLSQVPGETPLSAG